MRQEPEVIIPPVPSNEKQSNLEDGFLRAEDELPVFEEHEFKKDMDLHHAHHHAEAHTSTHTKTEQTKKKTKTEYVQLPFEVVHKVIRASCLLALLIWFTLIIFLSIVTDSSPFNTLVGLSPVILTIIVTYILVDKYHLESGFLMVFPFIFTGILFMLGTADLLPGMNYELLSSINIIFGVLFIAIITVHYSTLRRQRRIKTKEVEEVKEEKKEIVAEAPKEEMPKEGKFIVRLDDDESLKSFVSSIEDKSKALNAAIGRVYSVKNGGSDSLRKKIRIDSEHYNEINELKNQPLEKRRILAIELLRKIKDKLDLLMQPEKDVFDKAEMHRLLNVETNAFGSEKIERDAFGSVRILDILIKHDKDPVKSYYDGAVEFCDNALDELVANELEAMKAKATERKQRTIERAKKAIEEAKKKD